MQDTLVTPEQRVFYVAFKWVQQHWPNRVGRDSHIGSMPVNIWLDGQAMNTVLTAKIRLYDKAAHLIICECGFTLGGGGESVSVYNIGMLLDRGTC